MAVHLVSYDLVKDKDYSKLHERIQAYGTWVKIHKSFWGVKSEQTSAAIFDTLSQAMDADDKLFVTTYSGTGKWRKLGIKVVDDWMDQHMT